LLDSTLLQKKLGELVDQSISAIAEPIKQMAPPATQAGVVSQYHRAEKKKANAEQDH
jgi:hypothetical protein